MSRILRSLLLIILGFALGWIASMQWSLHLQNISFEKPVVFKNELTSIEQKIENNSMVVSQQDSNFVQALKENNIDLVFELMELIPDSDPQFQWDLDQLDQHLRNLMVQQKWGLLEEWLASGLQWRFDYVPFLLASAQRYLVLGQIKKSVEMLFQAVEYTQTEFQKTTILKKIEQQIQKQFNRARQLSPGSFAQDPMLISLINMALEKQPQYPPFVLMSSEMIASEGDLDSALQQLQWLPFNEAFQAQVSEAISRLEERQDQQRREQEGIPLEREKDQFFVTVLINQKVSLRLMIDTGASVTALTPQAIQRLISMTHLMDTGKRVRVGTANGSLISPVYMANGIQIEEWHINQVELLQVGMMHSADIDGLLGMNVLGQFAFHIDQKLQRLYLKQK